jgi:hypothetical protein
MPSNTIIEETSCLCYKKNIIRNLISALVLKEKKRYLYQSYKENTVWRTLRQMLQARVPTANFDLNIRKENIL